MEVSIICCVWNEFDRAPNQLKIVQEQLGRCSFEYEIIIIDNFSTDGTREWVAGLDDIHVVAILNEENIGKGGSIRKGIERSRGKTTVIFDLDGEYAFEDALTGVKLLEESGAIVSLASRTIDGSKNYVYLQNYLGVKLITWIINTLFGTKLTDTATGLKILNTQFFKQHKLLYSGFNVDFEIVCLALKHSRLVIEYKGFYAPRSKSEGKKIKAFKDGMESLFVILVTYMRAR